MEDFWKQFHPSVKEAYAWASAAHGSIGQLRKYGVVPYIVHPFRVFQLLVGFGVTNKDILIAALLHDVIEDVFPKNPVYSRDAILQKFGAAVLVLVDELTDVYTSEAYPKLNRKERKALESDRLANISNDGLKIKLGDYLDNTSDITMNDPEFARHVYLPEKMATLIKIEERVQSSGDQILIRLYNAARSQIQS